MTEKNSSISPEPASTEVSLTPEIRDEYAQLIDDVRDARRAYYTDDAPDF